MELRLEILMLTSYDNCREHQIGLYQGANMGLLKTVFEVNLSLFGGSAEQHAQGISTR